MLKELDVVWNGTEAGLGMYVLDTSIVCPAATYLLDDGGVVAVPPAAVEVQVGELVGQHGRLVLADASQERRQELHTARGGSASRGRGGGMRITHVHTTFDRWRGQGEASAHAGPSDVRGGGACEAAHTHLGNLEQSLRRSPTSAATTPSCVLYRDAQAVTNRYTRIQAKGS
jgi:hypothetical protein